MEVEILKQEYSDINKAKQVAGYGYYMSEYIIFFKMLRKKNNEYKCTDKNNI
jgi:hypothetical protein